MGSSMNKNEIIEAIQQTIIPNAQKGITAESLANLLIEIANATPEGDSGQIVFYLGGIDLETKDITQTPEEKAHNAEMYKKYVNSQITPDVSLDITKIFRLEYSTIFDESITNQMLANSSVAYSVYSPKEMSVEITGTDKGGIMIASDVFGLFLVTEDGSVFMTE